MTVQHITGDLLDLGVQPGSVLLVHSSLRSLGPLPGGAESMIQGLLDALGEEGTLLLPALSYLSVTRTDPVFDLLHTPSCVGALTEYFRIRPGTLRSVHPTHSVCGVGKRARELLADHALDTTPCGPHSPFSKLREVGGQILFIGCGLRPNTSMHAIEEHVAPPYLFSDWITYQAILPGGEETALTMLRHGFAGYIQCYDRVEALMDGKDIRKGRVLQAECYLLQAEGLWSAALAALQRDPLYFVEKSDKS